MNVKSEILDPVVLQKERDMFFNKRRKKSYKRIAKNVFKKIEKTSNPIELRKTLSKLSHRHSSENIKILAKDPLKPEGSLKMLKGIAGIPNKSTKFLLNYINNERFVNAVRSSKYPKTSSKSTRHMYKLTVHSRPMNSTPIAVSVQHKSTKHLRS